MTAAVRSPERRPVRVTIEGEAYHPAGDDRVLIVVRPNGAKLALTEGPGVVVEHIEPPRMWTDGDVVQETRTDRVWRRVVFDNGRHEWSNGFMGVRSDTTVTARVARGEDRVLRYQAGESV